jgi:hypothetical protein
MAAIAAEGLVPEIAAFDYWASERLDLSLPSLPVTIGRKAWDYRRGWLYYLASYTKAALALRTVEGLIGPETMARAMRGYVDRFRFRHPTGTDLVEALSEAAGRDLGPFFDQAVYSDAVADWAVESVRHKRPPSVEGFGWEGEEWREIEAEPSTVEGDDEDTWYVAVDLARRGEFIGPVEVELRWSDGTKERKTWDSETRWVRWRFDSATRLQQVVIDPDVVWVIETNRADNYWRARTDVVEHPLWWIREGLKLAAHVFLRFS